MCTSCIYNVFMSKQLTCKLADEGGSAWQGDGTETNDMHPALTMLGSMMAIFSSLRDP